MFKETMKGDRLFENLPEPKSETPAKKRSKLRKSRKKIGHGPGYSIYRDQYPRGGKTLTMDDELYGPMMTNSESGHTRRSKK